MHSFVTLIIDMVHSKPWYNEDLGTMKITLLYRVAQKECNDFDR